MLRRAALPLLVVIFSASAFAVLTARGQRLQLLLPATVGDLAAARNIELVDLTGKVLLAGEFATTSEDDDELLTDAFARPRVSTLSALDEMTPRSRDFPK